MVLKFPTSATTPTVINFATSTADSWNSPEQLTVREKGLQSPPLPPIDPNDRGQLPPNGGMWAVPPHLGFVSLVGMAWKAHHWAVDSALKHSRSNADAMLMDPSILIPLEKRLRAASQLSWHIEPLDETDNQQVKAAIKNTLAVSKTFKLQEAFYQWNWAKWYGKFALNLLYEWDSYQPDLMRCRDWTIIQGDSLIPRFANKDWGQLVNAAYDGPTEPYSLGRVHWYSVDEMESIVVHSYHSAQPDFFDTLSSGALRGRGLRHGSYWMYYYRANLLALLMNFLERLSNGIWKGKYDESNPQARADLEGAVAAYKSNSLLSLPMRRDGSLSNDLEIVEVGTASPSVLSSTIDYIDRLLNAYISGQRELSGSIGGDEVALHEGGISSVTKADAVSLAEDLTVNWLPTLYRYNSPGVPHGKFVFDVDSPNADKLLNYAVTMQQLGWAVDLDHLAGVCGLPKGSLNSNISTKIQPMSPVAVDQPPQGVPVAGSSPPQPSSPSVTSPAPSADTSQPVGVSA